MTRQFYYRIDACNATNIKSPDCICWHDEGSRALPQFIDYALILWREKPVADTEIMKSIDDAELWKLLPESAVYLDPPDGGSPSLLTQLQHMAEDARKWRDKEVSALKVLTMPNAIISPFPLVRLDTK